MKVENITDVDKFFEVVDKCEGRVELLTQNGDRLNLKSKFNQYTAMIKLLSKGTIKQMDQPPAMRVRDGCYTKKSPFHYNEVVQAYHNERKGDSNG